MNILTKLLIVRSINGTRFCFIYQNYSFDTCIRLGPSKIILGLPVKNIGLYCLYLIDNDRSKKTPRKGESKDVGDRFRELVSDWEPR